MGYNTWYDTMGAINEDICKQTVDAFVAKGFPAAGYNYWNLDDLWSGGRNADGSLFADPTKFPSKTLKPLGDYVHSKGLLYGSYTDRGTKQCGPGPGSYGHEAQDAQTFADWGVDCASCCASARCAAPATLTLSRRPEGGLLRRVAKSQHRVPALRRHARRPQQNRPSYLLLAVRLEPLVRDARPERRPSLWAVRRRRDAGELVANRPREFCSCACACSCTCSCCPLLPPADLFSRRTTPTGTAS